MLAKQVSLHLLFPVNLNTHSVLAHELAHAFMALQRFPPLPDAVAEGLCELWAHCWLSRNQPSTASTDAGARDCAGSDDILEEAIRLDAFDYMGES